MKDGSQVPVSHQMFKVQHRYEMFEDGEMQTHHGIRFRRP